MNDSVVETRSQSSDFNQLIADGGSNVIGGVQEYEVVTRVEGGRRNAMDFNICFDHQNERSSGFASGTMDFADNPNADLGAILKKHHEIQVRIHRSPKRMNVLHNIQLVRGRNPCLRPDPGNDTRWQGKPKFDSGMNIFLTNIYDLFCDFKMQGIMTRRREAT